MQAIKVVCCVCKRVKSRNGKWYRPKALRAECQITHTYCPKCERIAREHLAAYQVTHTA